MPYIKDVDRERYSTSLATIPSIRTKGELEYVVFSLMQYYMNNRVHDYNNLHDTVYAVQHCADEFRRRFLDAREDKAREENGDIE